MRSLALVFLLIGLIEGSRKCTFRDEAVTVKCSHQLMAEHLGEDAADVKEEQKNFTVDFRQVGRLCEKYEHFLFCAKNVTEKCKSKILGNLIPLWKFLCNGDFQKQAMQEESCFRAAQSDVNMQRCLANRTVDISNYRSQDFCEDSQQSARCFAEFHYLEKCQQAFVMQQSLYKYLMNASKSDCEFVELEGVMADHKAIEKEKALGGCDDNGVCKCIQGYKIDEETRRCVDIDECSNGTHLCPQKCSNTEGSYDCQCNSRFYSLSPSNNHSCILNNNDTEPIWLIFAHGQSIWNVSEDGKHVELKLAGLEKTAMIDVDIKENTVYFVDNGKNTIGRMVVNGNRSAPTKADIIQSSEVDGVEGIAIDYVGRNLYSARKSDIFVQTLDGQFRQRLYKNKLSTPRALIVHMEGRYLYGTDWSSTAFIYRAAMDGSDFEKVVIKGVVWPNALAIDDYAERMYWADAFLDTIQSSDLNGKNRRTIIEKSGAVAHVFGLAVNGDYMYWTDWNHRGIFRANKLDGQNVSLLAHTTLLPYSIKVFHESAQPPLDSVSDESNPCSNLKCTQLCILTPPKTNSSQDAGKEINARCTCADGYSLKKDGKTCQPDCKEPAQNIIVCGGSESKCVNKRYVCDGILHCPDRMDEQNCPERVCPLGQFQCIEHPRACLDNSVVCDGTKDCKDGSDERFCSPKA